ncbi:hypothetical protein A2U01_0054680, partial [Trifolium medium]|nr:hypothetical protein [Trifolium medium]
MSEFEENPSFDNPTNDVDLSNPLHSSGIFDDMTVPSKANVDVVPENSKGVQDNAVTKTPEFADRGEKEKTPENVMHGKASDTNTAVNSPSNESMKTEVVEVNDTTSEEKSVEETPA